MYIISVSIIAEAWQVVPPQHDLIWNSLIKHGLIIILAEGQHPGSVRREEEYKRRQNLGANNANILETESKIAN